MLAVGAARLNFTDCTLPPCQVFGPAGDSTIRPAIASSWASWQPKHAYHKTTVIASWSNICIWHLAANVCGHDNLQLPSAAHVERHVPFEYVLKIPVVGLMICSMQPSTPPHDSWYSFAEHLTCSGKIVAPSTSMNFDNVFVGLHEVLAESECPAGVVRQCPQGVVALDAVL